MTDDELLAELAIDAFRELGLNVLTLSWDGGAPTHCGAKTIYEWRGYYLVDDDVEPEGPFDTFEDAIDTQGFHFGGTPNPELTCDEKLASSPAFIAACIDLADGEGGKISINGVVFVRLGNHLAPVSD